SCGLLRNLATDFSGAVAGRDRAMRSRSRAYTPPCPHAKGSRAAPARLSSIVLKCGRSPTSRSRWLQNARPRRRGDRVISPLMHAMLHLLTSAAGTTRTCRHVRDVAAIGAKADISASAAVTKTYSHSSETNTGRLVQGRTASTKRHAPAQP